MAGVDEIMNKVRAAIFKSRSRTLEHFRPFDHLRSGDMKKIDFIRTLSKLCLDGLSCKEIEILSEHYASQKDSTKTNYAQFCADADLVFGPTGLEKNPLKYVPRPGEGVIAEFIPKSFEGEKEDKCRQLLFTVALLCKTRGIVFKYCYSDYDKLNRGTVTATQFRRALPFSISQSEQDLLIERYATTGSDGGALVNYRALHEDISEVATVTNQVKADEQVKGAVQLSGNEQTTQWTCDSLSVEQFMAAKVHERRVRLIEFFKDFDPLRKGKCTTEKVRCVLTNCKLELDQEQFNELANKYTMEDGMFNFKAMCEKIEDPATNPVTGPGPLRNCIVLSEDEKAYNQETMNQIKSMCVKGRIDCSEVLRDFDKCKQGHIPHSQFFRALQTMGLCTGDNDGRDIAMLALSFTNTGDANFVDYREFLKQLETTEHKGRSSAH